MTLVCEQIEAAFMTFLTMYCSLKNDNYAKEILSSLLPASPNESF